ncbi:MAG: GTPase Era [Gammaproteobacteria bacterium]|nr:GTPase Era [Gammaproteobacteria bacterium]
MSVRRSGYCAIVGRPNVGKSTLINDLIGQKLAITSHKPQTTRHSIRGIKTLPEGQIVYVDTPGIHQRGDQPLNRYLNRAARSAMVDVDAILFVVEALHWTAEDEAVLESVIGATASKILVVNKIDTVKDKAELLPFIAELNQRCPFLETVPVSALKGDNTGLLERQILERLPEGERLFPEDQLTDRSERFFASELIREQLTRRFSKEIPYALTVEIEGFEDREGLYRINALIWVEKAGQKNIIVGRKGESLKAVARQSRIEMEKFFGTRVYLEVWVKVKKSWSSDEKALTYLGYGG